MSRGETARLATQIGIALTAGMISIIPVAHGAPVLDSVVSGGASVVNSGTLTDITSTTKNNVINWQDFSVGAKETVQFDGGNKTNNYLNVVTGANTSQINGVIRGGKNVYLVNPNGVIFGNSAQVDVGNLYVSTRPISEVNTTAINASGDMTPLATNATRTAGDVVNMGSIAANSVIVEGNNIKFMDVEQITDNRGVVNDSVKLTASGSIRLGQNIESGNYGVSTVASGYEMNRVADNFTTITTASGLNSITNMAGNYELGNDIDLSGVSYTPIGDNTNPFTGNFDGNFYAVNNINVSSVAYGGLFGYTSGATIENVGVKNASVAAAFAGGIAGYAVNTTFTNVYNQGGNISYYNLKGAGGYRANAGGIVGVTSDVTIDTAYNTGTVSSYGGGIVGRLMGATSLENVYNTNSSLTQGLVGDAYNTDIQKASSIKNAYTTTAKVSHSNAGSIVKNNVYTSATSTALADYTFTDDAGNTAISNSGSDDTAWRIYEGQTMPLLRAFLRRGGSAVTVSYDYTMGSTTGNNGGSDLTNKELTYNSNYLMTSDVNYSGRDDIDTSLISYVGSGTSAAGGTSSLKNATSTTSLFYTGQDGYDLVGNNVAIEKRTIKIDSSANIDLSKVYDGELDATDAFKKAFENAGSDTAGVISGDDVEVGYSNDFAATFSDKNVGKDKDVTLSGTLSITGGTDADNYTLADGGVLNDVTIYGDITPRTLYLTINKLTGIDKTYDGTSTVTDTDATPSANITLDKTSSDTDHSVVSGDSVDLGALSGTATYVDVAGDTVTAAKNAGTHKVLYTGIALTGSDAGNYQLAYKNGSTETVLTSDSILLDGTINRRLILSNAFQVKDASGNIANGTKVYDGTSDYTLGDGYSLSTGDTSVSGDTGVISGDNIEFVLSTNGKSYFTDGTNATKDVAKATNISYSVEAVGDSDTLANYKIGTSATDATDLATGQTYSVLGGGTITRRALTVNLATDKGIDKEYDATDVVTDSKYLASNVGYADGSAKLINDEGGSITDDVAWTVAAKYASANVARDASGDATTQNVNYTITLTGDDAANYTLNGVNAETASVGLTATGTISPKDVTASFATITKTYNGTTALDGDVTASSATISGMLAADDGKVAVSYDTKDAYFDSKNAGSRTVTYTGLGLTGASASNYNLKQDSATTTGTINKRAITKDDVVATFGKIEKTYDNTTTADATQLQSLTVNNVTDDDLVFSVTNAVYNNKNRLGNADLQTNGVTYTVSLTDADQLNNYTLGDGLTGNSLALTTDGYIYQRELTVAAVDTNPTKQYDGTTDVIGASGTVLTGDTLVTITGLYADGTTNATTAEYSNKNAGSRTVKYALALDNEPAGSSNYKFVDASGNTINSITTNGTINKRELYATFDNVTKVYDTNSTVAADKIKATLTDANGNTDSVAASEGVTLAIGTNGVTGTYGLNTGDTFTADADVGTKTVKYTNLIAALGNNADNYTIADTTYGAGSITPASITADSFKFTFDTITKTYDGTTAIDGTDAASAVLNHYVDLGLNANPDFTYTINSAAYKDKNAGTGKDVTYTITIDLSTLTNYEVTGVTGSTLTQSYTQNNGVINRKAVYASIKNNALTKTYDATTAVKDASGTVLTGDDIITLDGLTGNDGATNISTAAYTDKNVGAGNKVINYTVALDAASAGNYVIYKDADKGAANKTELTSAWASAAVNTITPYSLKLAFSQAVKDYDGTTDVYTANGSAQADLESGLLGDDVSLATGYTAAYDDPNVKGKNGDGKHTVTYDKLVLTGADAGNYVLADSTGTSLSASKTTDGTYTTTGDGVINKFRLTEAPTFSLATVTKEYDGTDAVAYTGTGKDGKYYYRDTSADALQNYVLSDATVMVNGKTVPVYFTISNAKYTADKDVGTNKDVSFVVTLSGDNYDFSGLSGINADGSFSGAATATTGDITKRGIYISLDDSIIAEKTYDGDAFVDNDVTSKIIVRESDILDSDKNSVSLDRTAINATYVDKNAGTGKTVNYTLTLTGAGSENYEIHDLTKLGATGDDAITSITSKDGIINKAKLTVSFDGGINKTYDGTSAIDPTKIQSHDVHFKGYVANEDLGDLSRTALDTIKGDYGTGTSADDFTTNANVSWSGDTPTSKAMHYDLADLNEWLKTDSVGKNYELAATDVYYSAADNKGGINPIYVDNITKTWAQASKVYDATTDLPGGKNASDYLTIKANASDGTELNVVYTTDSAGYDNKNVGTDHKLVYNIDSVKQKLTADGGATYNYYLADSTTAGLLGEQTSAANNTISVRTITATLGTTTGIDKVYDATTDVLAQYTDGSNLTLTDDDLAVLAKDGITPTITSAYDGKDAGAHKVIYTLSGIDSANYSLTDGGIYTASGEIAKATLNVDFGAIDRTYEKGNTAIKLTGDKITLSGVTLADGTTETVTLDAAALAKIKGNYGNGTSATDFTADGNVSWDGDTVVDKDILYTGLADALASQIAGGDSIASNYTIADTAYFTAAQAKGKIKPIAITQGATANWTAATKTYDATTAVLDPEKYLGITYTDGNGDVVDIGYELAAAAYDSKNVGDNRTLNYTLKSVDKKATADGTNYNYVVDDSYADTLVGNTWTSAANNTIKKLTINAALTNTTGIDKVYDGTTEVLAAYQGESNLVIDKTAQDVLARDGISAVITESYDEANAGDRKVTYTLGLDTVSDNYELASDTYQATGTIARRGLTITATPEKVRVGDAMPDFSGTITGYVASDASLIEEFQNKLLNFKVDDDVTTAKPGKYAVYGWYTNAAGETLTAGDFGQNYTFSQDASNATAFYVELVDPGREYHENVNPKTQFIPDHTSYNQAAMDYSGAYRGNGAAALEYQDSRGTVLGEIAITGVATGTNNITGSGTVTGNINTNGTVMAPGVGASYGIAGGNVVNVESLDVATSASVEVAGDGEIVNLEVRPLTASEIAIESTDSTDGATA